jgi:hypothetical protein
MDALSETLRVVRLVGAIFINARFTAPWCYQSPRADSVAPILEPGAERVVIFHLITEGDCYVELAGEPPVHLIAGDAIIFPQGDAHRMTSQPGLPPATGGRLDEVLSRRPRQLSYGGGGPRRASCAAIWHATHGSRDCCWRACLRCCQGQRARLQCRHLARGLGSLRAGRGTVTPAGWGGGVGQAVRSAVHRGLAPVHERAGRRMHRLACRRGRPDRRCRA